MNLKKLVWLMVLSASATLSTAHAAAYVSDGMSFASLTADTNVERTAGNSFERFTSNALLGGQQAAPSFDNSSGTSRGVSSSGASASSNSDTWLMLLIGSGLVALQLRRKQKSLPHRPLASVAVE